MRALSTAASFGRHRATAVVEALILLAILVTLTLGLALASGTSSPAGADSVFAARGGKGGGGGGHGGTTAQITVPDGRFGGTTTATVSPPGLWVYNACSRSGSVVSQQWVITDSAGKAVLYLGPTAVWTSGSASCVAQVGSWSSKGSFVVQGSTTFSVSA